MVKACVYKPNVKNKEGKVVPSRLFDSLLAFFNKDRYETKKHYFIATHPEFLESFKEDLEFDENGEVTIESYLKATKQTADDASFLNYLNQSFGAGEYDVNDAIAKAQAFSKGDFSKGYIPSLTWVKNGKVRLEYVVRTPMAENNLYTFYKQKNLVERIINKLREAGVSVDFLEQQPKEDALLGRYTTANAEKTYDGLYSLISIFSGIDVAETLAEEAGHFVYGALGNDILIQRLNSALTEEVLNSFTSEEIDIAYSDIEKKKEIAGKLIGKALINQEKGPLFNLLNRIKLKAQKLFAKIKLDDVKKLKIEAELAADRIAQNFLSSNFKGTVENAISQSELLYSKKSPEEARLYDQIKNELDYYRRKMSSISYSLKKKYGEQVPHTVSFATSKMYDVKGRVHLQYYAVNGITSAVKMLINDYESIIDKLVAIDFSSGEVNYKQLDAIQEGRVFVTTAASIIALINSQLESHAGIVVDENSKLELLMAVDKLSELLHKKSTPYIHPETGELMRSKDMTSLIERLELDAYSIYLEKTYGSKYIQRAKRVVLDKFLRIRKLRPTEPESLIEYLKSTQDSLFDEDSPFGYFINSFHNIKDPTMSIFNDMVRQAIRFANQEVLDYRTGLLNLYDRLYEMQHGSKVLDPIRNPVDAAIFYETDDNGEFTGNIIQPVHWGKWEEDLEIEKEKAKEAFYLAYKDHPEKINTSYKRANEWYNFWKPRLDAWHATHSIKEEVEEYDDYGNPTGKTRTVLRPAIGLTYMNEKGEPIEQVSYINEQWNKLSHEERKWITDWVSLKTTLDRKLGREGHTAPHRLPQFRGDAIERVKTAVQQHDLKRGIRALGEVMVEEFIMTSEDSDYGSDLHYKSAEEDFLDSSMGGIYGETINRVPLYGINKLFSTKYIVKDKDGNVIGEPYRSERIAKKRLHSQGLNPADYIIEQKKVRTEEKLSRDLFHSTLLYAEMACKYKALSEVSKAASLGGEIYKKRNKAFSEGTTAKSKESPFNTAKWKALSSFGRFTAFIDKALFGRYNMVTIGKVSLNKAMSFISGIGSNLFLGGNITVGFKDFSGKLNGILREAHIHEYCSQESIDKAIKWWCKNCIAHALNWSNDKAEDPISLFKLHFNVSDIYDSTSKEFRPQKSRLRKFLNNTPWMFLSMSSSIETIVSAALAFEAKVYDHETMQEMSLMDLYEIQASREEGGRKQLVQKTTALTEKLGALELEDYKLLSSIVSKLESFFALSQAERKSNPIEHTFTDEENDYLKAYYNATIRSNPALLLEATTSDKVKHEVTPLAENKLVEAKARIILGFIAGNYNKLDRTAFQDTWLGAAALNMRGWFTGTIAEGGLNSDRYSPILGKDTEGFYTSNLKFIIDVLTPRFINEDATEMKTLIKAFGSSLPVVHFLFNKEDVIREFEDAGYSKHQYNNIKRNIDNWISIGVLHLLSHIFKMLSLKGLGDEDDPEDDNQFMFKFFGILHYLTKATEYEFLGMYNPVLAFKQAMNFTSINAFTPIAGLVRLGELAGLGALEILEGINNWFRPEDEVYQIVNENNKHQAYLSTDNIWDFLLAKDDYGEVKYRTIQELKYDAYGNPIIDPKTGKQKRGPKKDSNGNTIYVPIYKTEYQKANPSMGVEAGDSKFLEKGEKMLPIWRHRDVLRDPITAAENLTVVWDKNKR